MIPRTAPFPRPLRWLLALIPLGAAFGASLRALNNVETRTHAESMFVRRDSFAIHQAAEATLHADEIRRADSAFREMLHIVSGLDSSDHCRRGFRNYCR